MKEFCEKYLLLNLKDYPNINIDFQISLFLFFLTIGIVVASIIISYRRAQYTRLIKSLLRHDALGDGTAKTISELGITAFGARTALSTGRIKKIVCRQGEVNYSYDEYCLLLKDKNHKEEKVDFSLAKFFLREEKVEEAKRIADDTPVTITKTLLLCIMIFAIYICVALALPQILTLLNGAL